MNFNKVKISCSDLPFIMSTDIKPLTELQEKEYDVLKSKYKLTEIQKEKLKQFELRSNQLEIDKSLSNAAKRELKDVYVREKYGKNIVSLTKDFSIPMLNGTISEQASLKMVSVFNNEQYNVNKELVTNAYLKGKLDAYTGKSVKKAKKVIEVKTASSMQSLLSSVQNKKEVIDKYYWQLMGYMFISNADVAEIYHVLPSYDKNVVAEVVKRVLNRAKGIGMQSKQLEKIVNDIRFNLSFDEIPIENRIIRFSAERSEMDIERIRQKVVASRKYLKEFEFLHFKINENA